MQYYIVDVFTETKYTGNQLAVVRHAEGLSTAQMKAITREMNYSETTFILSDTPRNGGYDVRIFTMGGEIPFAGHPTLGTAYTIRREIIGQPVAQVTLNLGVGQIPVTFGGQTGQGEELWMHQKPPTFGELFEVNTLARVLSLQPDDFDTRFPIQDVSTGLPFILVPLKTLDAVRRCQHDRTTSAELLRGSLRSEGIFVFAPQAEKPQNHFHARMFSPEMSRLEDPATGSANGCLAGYLVKRRYFGSDEIDVRVEQGYAIQRPSLLKLRAAPNSDDPELIDVFVGGGVVMVAEGRLV